MTGRARDILLALVGMALVAVPFAVVVIAQALLMGRPLFHASERIGAFGRPFTLYKLRSMHPAPGDTGVSGGDKADRIPRWGAFLRASRLDELPQLWNVLRGDMRVVGPRPPLRRYATLLRSPPMTPGLTGLATIAFHRHERRLLSVCRTAAETEAVYLTRCLPRKARLDRIYHRRQGAALDLLIVFWTLTSLARPGRHRLPRRSVLSPTRAVLRPPPLVRRRT